MEKAEPRSQLAAKHGGHKNNCVKCGRVRTPVRSVSPVGKVTLLFVPVTPTLDGKPKMSELREELMTLT